MKSITFWQRQCNSWQTRDGRNCLWWYITAAMIQPLLPLLSQWSNKHLTTNDMQKINSELHWQVLAAKWLISKNNIYIIGMPTFHLPARNNFILHFTFLLSIFFKSCFELNIHLFLIVTKMDHKTDIRCLLKYPKCKCTRKKK